MKSILLFFLLPVLSHAQLGYKEQSIKKNDSMIINNTVLKLYCLFDTQDTLNKDFHFLEPLYGNVKVCGNKNVVIINAGGIAFQLKATGVLLDSVKSSACKKSIATRNFGGSKRIKELENGDTEITFDLDKKYISTKVGTIEVSPQELQCDDTGTNPFRITSNGMDLIFKEGGNLVFFEFDSNLDKKTELYVINYFSCLRRFELYKIE